MKKALWFILLGLTACGPITKEELDQRFAKVDERLSKLEERQRRLEEQNIKTETRVDNLAESLTKLRLEVEKLKTGKDSTVSVRLPEESKKNIQIQQKPSESYQAEYDEAMNLYNQKQLSLAKEKFIEFIRKNPKTPLTDNAYFWLGAVFRDLGELDKAQAVWLTLVEKCKKGELPDCNKAPSAYLQLAKLYELKGDRQRADEFYENVIKDYPLSEEAEIAKRKLGK
ncbi:tetratricopeptide repeat protein [Hydrogenobacter hydrogenophilus]|uniref:Tol-pal system protein YbgF n=1 Tax=Hydrogenobacter hydrogenophilus TaxID=35835 RepID=A0A285NTX6_9AQUI|nr:tetratricopeptide repeat protein [Hydrogenobacter hydrogenophilus]SNZ12920.1 tol-pal system protein YbgF [Hydrogenobacter hydrogenophilus]